MLRVINNDTGAEIPRVFQKVAPYVYKKNDVSHKLFIARCPPTARSLHSSSSLRLSLVVLQKGYTFVAEARTTDTAQQAGKWRMRLIGSLSQLPAPIKNEVNASFHAREIRDYYVPNERNCIFRSVQTSRPCGWFM